MSEFTEDLFCDSVFTEETNFMRDTSMVLYAYINKESANSLMKFFIGSYYNQTLEYMKNMPIQLPLNLYENESVASMFKPANNYQLVAFDINTACKMFDDLNPVDKARFTNGAKLKAYKESGDTILLRELKKLERTANYYIQYTIRNKRIIKNIKLIDNIH